MLEVFRDLEIRGVKAQNIGSFIGELGKALPSGWSRDRNREKEINRYTVGGPQYAFYADARNDRPAARVFLFPHEDALTVSNVVPDQISKLTRRQYNSVLEEFEQICSPVAGRHGYQIYLTPDQRDISEFLSRDAMLALRKFSGAANKSTGSSHPLDFQRWMNFIILAHRDGDFRLDTQILTRWLVEEERWPREIAADLSSEFQLAREVLKAYDKSR